MTESTDRIAAITERVRDLLQQQDAVTLRIYLDDQHGSDLADLIEALEPEQRVALVEFLPAEMAADALAEMEEIEKPGELLVQLQPERIGEIVEEMADDDAADIIGELEPEDQAKVLSSLPVPEATEIEELLGYPEESAGGIMTRDVLAVRSDLTAIEAIQEIRRQAQEDFDFYTIFVTEPDGALRGVVALQDLVISDPDHSISGITEEPMAVVQVDTDQEDVGRVLARYNIPSVGVVDAAGRLVGRVTFDDVIDVIEAESTEDILRFAAVSDEEEVRGTTLDAIRSRLPWLLLNLATASIGATVVWHYQSTIEALVLLAVVMPIVAGLGGNAGTQALAVTIRRIAVADEPIGQLWRVVGKEAVVGLLNGLVVGLVAAVAGHFLIGAGVRFGAVVLLAMWGNMVVASFAGAFFPIFLESVGIDPAVASSVFVTALTDLSGFLLLLGLASAVLL
ncbi:MAG: magnesium transporter [marine benthic group bacterium]|nr:magnesium transporter [Candidatus Carthagonibacter metallireducens]